MGIVTGSRKENTVPETTSTASNPKSLESPEPTPAPPQLAVASMPSDSSVQNTLLALLSQAAQGSTALRAPLSQNPDVASLGAPQLALLQQLALTAQLGSVPPTQLPVSQSTGQPLVPNGSTTQRSSQEPRPTHLGVEMNRQDPRVSRFMDRDTRQADNTSNQYDSHRGGYRGRGRGRWVDHRSYGERNGRSPSRHDRSRSPKRSSASRDPRSGQSPNRSSNIRPFVGDRTRESGKDEFGRELRQSSSTPTNSPTPDETRRPRTTADASQMDTSVTANTSARPVETHTSGSAPASATPASSEPGLDKFDITTFDFTLPSSWEALGKMWRVTCGYAPSQEELMQFVVTSGASLASSIPAAEATASSNEYTGTQWNAGGGGVAWRGGRGRGGPARGGRGYGNYRGNGHAAYSNAHTHSSFQNHSDAVVLGDDGVQHSGSVYQDDGNSANPAQSGGSGSNGGKMQRVGDRWMFVKDSAAVQGA